MLHLGVRGQEAGEDLLESVELLVDDRCTFTRQVGRHPELHELVRQTDLEVQSPKIKISLKPRRCSSVGRASFKGPILVQLYWLTWVQIPALQYKEVGKIVAI